MKPSIVFLSLILSTLSPFSHAEAPLKVPSLRGKIQMEGGKGNFQIDVRYSEHEFTGNAIGSASAPRSRS